MIFFYFLKIIFGITTSKRSKTHKKINFLKKKLNFLETRVQPRFQTLTNLNKTLFDFLFF